MDSSERGREGKRRGREWGGELQGINQLEESWLIFIESGKDFTDCFHREVSKRRGSPDICQTLAGSGSIVITKYSHVLHGVFAELTRLR